jgi:hypothetical protein
MLLQTIVVIVFLAAGGCSRGRQTPAERETPGATASRGHDSTGTTDEAGKPPAPAPLEGTWGWVSGEKGGETLLIAPARIRQQFQAGNLIVVANGLSSTATVAFSPDKEPKQYDVTAGGRKEQVG